MLYYYYYYYYSLSPSQPVCPRSTLYYILHTLDEFINRMSWRRSAGVLLLRRPHTVIGAKATRQKAHSSTANTLYTYIRARRHRRRQPRPRYHIIWYTWPIRSFLVHERRYPCRYDVVGYRNSNKVNAVAAVSERVSWKHDGKKNWKKLSPGHIAVYTSTRIL